MSSAAKSLIARRTERLCAEIATKDAEIKRLRSALEKIANDPYQYGQRVQRMKIIARSALSPIPDPAGGMPVEVKCTRCHGKTVEPDFNGYCPVCHDDMGEAKP